MVDVHARQGRCLLSVPDKMSLAISTFSLIWKSNMPILPVGKAALVRSLAIFASSSQGGCPAILILAKLYQNSPSIPTYVGRTYNLAVNRKHSEKCRKAQKSIVFSILASIWTFARVRILSRFFASFRGI